MAEKSIKDRVWDAAKKAQSRDPDQYRRDPYGNLIRKDLYGKDAEQGWVVDHITPRSRGGSDNIRNLQALQTATNREKADSLIKRSRHSSSGR